MINTELFKSTMEKIHNKILEEKQLLVEKDIPVKGVSDDDDIEHLIKKTSDTTFKLLIMGQFSSGKSAFVNVLLGEKILPENALPSTALITEVYYGTEKKVVMYPRKGKWQGGNEPFEIEPTLEEIKKYSTINNKAGLNKKEANRVDSSFEKMAVYWPLEMLKDGVSIIDSPGTNDPYCNDYIVESYVPKADAILYCIAGTQAYNAEDKKTLDRLNSLGYNPIIATTYFDVVTDGMSDSEKEEFVDTTFESFYSLHTSKECCHYVNSRLGLASKRNNSQADYVESGYCELEKFLGEYLTENKGLEKISIATASAKLFNKTQVKRIDSIMENLDAPMDEFNQKVADAEKKLEQANKQGELAISEFSVEANREKKKIDDIIPSLFDAIYDNINLDGFEPNTSFTMWHPKESSSQIAEECSKELEIRNKQLVSDWVNDTLTPNMTEAFKNIISKVKSQIDSFDADIKKANISISTQSAKANTDVSGVTKASMIAYTILTGDWMTAIVGGTLGFGAFARTMLCQFTAGIVLGIVGIFTPIGLPALIIASLAGLIAGVSWNSSKAADSIKNKAVNKMKESLRNDKEKIIADTQEKCAKVFKDAEKQLRQAVEEDIATVKNIIEVTKKEREKNQNQIAERKAELEAVKKFVDETDDEMDSIRKEFNI